MEQEDVFTGATDLHMKINIAYPHKAAGFRPRPEFSHCVPRCLRGHVVAARMARFNVCASAWGNAR